MTKNYRVRQLRSAYRNKEWKILSKLVIVDLLDALSEIGPQLGSDLVVIALMAILAFTIYNALVPHMSLGSLKDHFVFLVDILITILGCVVVYPLVFLVTGLFISLLAAIFTDPEQIRAYRPKGKPKEGCAHDEDENEPEIVLVVEQQCEASS